MDLGGVPSDYARLGADHARAWRILAASFPVPPSLELFRWEKHERQRIDPGRMLTPVQLAYAITRERRNT